MRQIQPIRYQTVPGNLFSAYNIINANFIIEVKGRDFYNDYCEFRRDECIEAGFKYEFVFDDENVRERFDEIALRYKLMI